MNYPIQVLTNLWRDHIATANALELRMGKMLEPNTEAAVDHVRTHRLKAGELARAIKLLEADNVTPIQGAG